MKKGIIILVLIILGFLVILLLTKSFKSEEVIVEEVVIEESEIVIVLPLELDPAKYSFDFADANKIIVQYKDFSTTGGPRVQRELEDEKQIQRIFNILKSLPKDGDLNLDFSPGLTTTVAGYKDDSLVAYVEFHRTLLRTENGAFYGNDDKKVGQLESEFYSLVAELQ